MLARRTSRCAPSARSGAGFGSARNMATLREIELRLKSIKNIEKITKSMKMIASTQLAKAQRAMAAGKQYGIANSGPVFANSTSATSTETGFIVISSDKGLCGGIHSSVTKAMRHALAPQSRPPRRRAQARRGGRRDAHHDCRRQGEVPVPPLLAGNQGRPDVADAAERGPYDSVVIIYNKFVSAISYEPTAVEVRGEAGLKESDAKHFYCRRNAMDNASKNATEMITSRCSIIAADRLPLR
ncbi:ATPase, F1 complex, gamma subunit domain-containing protein [Mycena olivaceomarginata]|nr:ATPase, F1 complex, gamma subunit domain-containing protein [Mycena olivaceomarginata]